MKKQINYKVFFPVGIAFIGAGAVFLASVNEGVGAGLIILGVVYMILGLKNKPKKKK